MALCRMCNTPFPTARQRLGMDTCLKCGERAANQVRHTIAPLHKSNYMLLMPEELKQLNPKRTT